MIRQTLFPPLNQARRTGVLPLIPQGDRIPKRIHQVFYTRYLPAELAANVERIRQLNPGWDHRLYDDEDMAAFVERYYGPAVVHYFKRIDERYGAARADLFRYLLLYRCGGVYLDMKSTLTRPLDEVIRADDRYLLSRWQNGRGQRYESYGLHHDLRAVEGGEFQQWHIACCAGHPFLRAVIETVLDNIDRYIPSLHETGKPGVLRVTGPIAYTLAIAPLLDRHPHRLGDSITDFGFQYSIYEDGAHAQAFRNHYSRQTHPVVRITPVRRAWGAVIGAAKAARSRAALLR